MTVRKAIIPAAGMGTRFLPATKAIPKEMLPIIDKPTIQYIVEEAVAAGIEEILIVTGKGKQAIEDHFDSAFELEYRLKEQGKQELLRRTEIATYMASIHYIRQHEPKGLGNAIGYARQFVQDEPFAVLLGDTFFDSEIPVIKQLMDSFLRYRTSIIGIQGVREEKIPDYGIIACRPTMDDEVYQITDMIEKPTLQEAPSDLAMLGRYVLTPSIFDELSRIQSGIGNELQLTDALAMLMKREALYAKAVHGKWHDVGDPAGYVRTIMAYAGKRGLM